MLFTAQSAAVYGIDASLIDVEVEHIPVASKEDHHFQVVGLPDPAVRESGNRVRAAIRNSGYNLSPARTTINLAPADHRKEGPRFDLPIAVGILGANGALEFPDLCRFLFVGELGMNGSVRAVPGILAVAMLARDRGIPNIIVPFANGQEAAMMEGVNVYPVSCLREVIELLNGQFMGQIQSEAFRPAEGASRRNPKQGAVDFKDVCGQQTAKRALEVAAAGGHNILMIGPPGSGKTMLAELLPSILPPPELVEMLETTRIHSVAGVLDASVGMVKQRPFRSPHHSVSHAGLLGGGNPPRPGEVCLAHNGVLFLDELPEFSRGVLEGLRQPLESHSITIVRASGPVNFPARFMLAAAMNPCPCGYLNDRHRECNCTPPMIQRYIDKISGPLLDRIDIQIDVPAVGYKDLHGATAAEGSAEVRDRVMAARLRQVERFAQLGMKAHSNAQMSIRHVREISNLDPDALHLLEQAMLRGGLTARAHDRIIKVARTIADLEGAERLGVAHLAEAIQYRTLDSLCWA